MWGVFVEYAEQLGTITYTPYGVALAGDDGELLGPVDNWIDYGAYERTRGAGFAYAARLPGYGFPYVFLRLFSGPETARFLLVVFQIALSSLALTLFARLLARSRAGLISGLIIGCFFVFSLPWEHRTYPDSLALSAFMLGLVAFSKARSSVGHGQSTGMYLLSGALFTWLFFLRGFYGPFFLFLFGIIALAEWRKQSIRRLLITATVFFLPLVIAESAWVLRNYHYHEKFIPLQDTGISTGENADNNVFSKYYGFGSSYKPTIIQLRNVVNLWGGDNFHPYTNSELRWFMIPIEGEAASDAYFREHFPKWITADPDLTHDFKQLKHAVRNSYAEGRAFEDQLLIEKELLADINQTIAKTKAAQPLTSQLAAPLRRVKNLFFRNVTSDWPMPAFGMSDPLSSVWRLGVLLMYALGLLYLLLITFTGHAHFAERFLFAALLTIIGVFAFLIPIQEFKYGMIPAVTGGIALAVRAGDLIATYWRKRQSLSNHT